MTEGTATLGALSRADRAAALEAVLTEEFKAVLMLSADEELPLDAGFFDELGLTSVSLTETKRRLETRLGCPISANVMFNRPTVRDLVAYLTDATGPQQAADEPAAECAAPGRQAERALVDDVLGDLYRT